ncbi:MAG: rod shape-determining protein MreC [Chloroflexi bacterium]|nr:rod shape-determining protein MreC [Chloroflexota bacterium]
MNSTNFRRGWRSNRSIFLIVSLIIAVGLIIASQTGLLSPLEDLVSAPLNAVSGLFNRAALAITDNINRFGDVQTLQQRIADLEEALALYQTELVEAREIVSDYGRLANLLDYRNTAQNQETLTADVIGVDVGGGLRTIAINRGTRDGIAVGMPVVTGQGLVGRIIQVSANAARVMLITETTSRVSARMQTNRVEGSVVGLASGNLIMELIRLDAPVREGDLVLTSGLGGNFPPDIVIGQVTSVRPSERGLYQEAQVRSLINFDTLEFVLVVTNFQPTDLSVFEESTGN